MQPRDVQAPSIDEQRAFYDDWNRDHRSGGYDEIDPRVTVRTTAALEAIARLGLPADARILEVGCGTGWLSERLRAFGTVEALDLSEEAIEIARARGLDVEFRAADFLELDLMDLMPFDLVVCAETLFYVEDQQAFVDRLAAVTKPGGTIVFTMINKYVYERSEGIPPPDSGQIRSWLGRREMLRMLRPHFRLDVVRSLDPGGHGGLLRLVNSPRLNGWLERVVSADLLRRAKEHLGLGGGFVVVAKKPGFPAA